MYFGKMISTVLALLLAGSVASAAPAQGDREERFNQRSDKKTSRVYERGSRGTEMRQRTDRPSSTGIRTDRPTSATQRPASRPATRQHVERERTKRSYMIERGRESVKRDRTIRKTPLPVHRESRRVVRPVPPRARPLPHYHRPGYVIRRLPNVALSLTLGGLLFYYADGIYYRHHTGGYVVAVPPVGLIVPRLPLGYVVYRRHGITYYYYADVYYVWDTPHRGYRVVEAPDLYAEYKPGDVVDVLPDGAYSVTIDGVQYYRYRGVYFLQSIQRDRIVYIVVTP
jgi:hypothetical protein